VSIADLRRDRNRVRTRLAIGLTVSTLLVAAAIAVGATLIAAWQAGDSEVEAQAGAARVTDNVAVVIITDEGAAAAAAQARSDTLRWSLIALAVSLLPAIAVGWFAAGRMLGTVDNALADVEAADEQRERRLQEIVHELRTPLAVMGTNLELAAAQPDTDNFIEAALRAATRMGRTVDDLAGHGRLAVDACAGRTDLGGVAGDVISEFTGPAHARGLHLRSIGESSVALDEVDSAALRTVVGNFVGNAVRLAPRGSTVALDWGKSGAWAWIAVTDEGPGLPPELHSRVFERGWQGRHDRDRADGTRRGGLGLTIARQMAEAQGGAVSLDSDEGAGSTFTLWLPTTPDASRIDVIATDGVHARLQPWHRDSVQA
jgi:signal transduction histidine kinase